jgi:elongator complex protein 3
MNSKAYQELLAEIETRKAYTKKEAHKIKVSICRKFSLSKIPKDSELLAQAPEKLKSLFILKSVRTVSGVAVIAVMSSPEVCPHGKCIYCPGGPEKGTPQSYTGKEPAALRASMYNYDPYLQTVSRLEQLRAIGHETNKIELIVMGGTFTARNSNYQTFFVKRCLDAMNNVGSRNLAEAQKINETARARCVGLTFETRPDFCQVSHIRKMLVLGATRVELGVQTLYDNILEKLNRGHDTQAIINATKLLKDAGLKVCYHLMPGLPGVSKDMDLESFRRVFYNEDLKPDQLKIYPTVVIKGTELYKLWKSGRYNPLTTEEAIELLAKIKSEVPRWLRIQRIQRDIPSQLIIAGVKKSNLRQLIKNKMEAQGLECKCIRCREVGYKAINGIVPTEQYIKLRREDYNASDGKEIFLSFEDLKNNVLVAYARLRASEKPWYKLLENSLIIRELKVVGRVVSIGKNAKQEEWQHKGYGKKLLKECERIALEEFGARRVFVNSGIGAKNYYRKLGYKSIENYLVKFLK